MNRVNQIILLIVATIFAVLIALNIGTADYLQIGIYGVMAVGLYFAVHGWRKAWAYLCLLLFSNVMFYQGFSFTSEHLFFGLLVGASAISLVSQKFAMQIPEVRQAGSRSTAVIIGILLCFGLFHFAGNYAMPYSPMNYSVKNCLKAYFECFASMACLLWLMSGPYSFRLNSRWATGLVCIIVVALLGNIAAMGHMYLQGYDSVDGLSTGGLDDYMARVPVINMYASIFSLRHICPLCCVILLMLISSTEWRKSVGIWVKALILVGLLLCLAGTVMSGGRVTLLFCLSLAFGALVLRKKMVLICMVGAAAIALVAFVNVFAHEINNKAPMTVARSLQFVMLEKGHASFSISSSQDCRNAAFKEAIRQWQEGGPRLTLFGRSVYHVSASESIEVAGGSEIDRFVVATMRSGRTHNLITDLLIQYGLVGLVLYLTAYVIVIRFVLRLYRSISERESLSKALAGALLLYVPLMFVYQLWGGGYMPMFVPLLIGLIRGHLTTQRAPELVAVPEVTPQERRGNQITPMKGRFRRSAAPHHTT